MSKLIINTANAHKTTKKKYQELNKVQIWTYRQILTCLINGETSELYFKQAACMECQKHDNHNCDQIPLQPNSSIKWITLCFFMSYIHHIKLPSQRKGGTSRGSKRSTITQVNVNDSDIVKYIYLKYTDVTIRPSSFLIRLNVHKNWNMDHFTSNTNYQRHSKQTNTPNRSIKGNR